MISPFVPISDEALDRIAVLYGVTRQRAESDEDLRQRILGDIKNVR